MAEGALPGVQPAPGHVELRDPLELGLNIVVPVGVVSRPKVEDALEGVAEDAGR